MVWSDYGSSEEKLDYFGKLERPEQHDLVGFTEVARKNSITSVIWIRSEQHGLVGLRK